MADPFTHDFTIDVDSKTISGQIEFDVDGIVSYAFSGNPQLKLLESQTINQIFAGIQDLYKMEGGLVKFKIIKK